MGRKKIKKVHFEEQIQKKMNPSWRDMGEAEIRLRTIRPKRKSRRREKGRAVQAEEKACSKGTEAGQLHGQETNCSS